MKDLLVLLWFLRDTSLLMYPSLGCSSLSLFNLILHLLKSKEQTKGWEGGFLFVYHTPSFNRGTSGLESSLKSPYVSPEQVMVSWSLEWKGSVSPEFCEFSGNESLFRVRVSRVKPWKWLGQVQKWKLSKNSQKNVGSYWTCTFDVLTI